MLPTALYIPSDPPTYFIRIYIYENMHYSDGAHEICFSIFRVKRRGRLFLNECDTILNLDRGECELMSRICRTSLWPEVSCGRGKAADVRSYATYSCSNVFFLSPASARNGRINNDVALARRPAKFRFFFFFRFISLLMAK